MQCTAPIPAWHPKPEAVDKRLVFNPRLRDPERVPLSVPCGKCYNCRAIAASQWGTRCSLEMQDHNDSMFLTLTYAPEHLPADLSVSKREFQLFLKRLRIHLDREVGDIRIRYIGSGEYGGQTGRPHYHILIFGWSFPDGYRSGGTDDKPYYNSPTLERLWPFGISNYSLGSEGVAHYVAGYTVKKLKGDPAPVDFIDGATGEVTTSERQPEFLLMSRNPGLGFPWLERFKSDLDKGFLTIGGRTKGIPRAFLNQLKKIDPDMHEELTYRRRQFMLHKLADNPDQRLFQRHQIGLDNLARNERDKYL